jgi:hypothetical protein
MGRRLFATVGISALAAIAATSAQGDGGPGPGVVQGWDGIARGSVRYVAFATGTNTVLEVVKRRGGRVVRYSILPGGYGIPQVAFDGTTAGLSHDGRTLVLGDVASSPQLRKTSSFAVVSVHGLRLQRIVRLRGDFTFDALSPNTRMLYLIEHVSSQDTIRYRVRAYDLGGRRLLPQVVVDKTSWESVMRGYPYKRVVTGNGRWVYTLYSGGEHPFVHALDTRYARAVCIDLPKSWNKLDVGSMSLRLTRDARLLVRYRSGGRPLAVVDAKDQRLLSIVRVP